ncbi:MAG TPA: inorganic diphosphatase [Bryobacteraceae bacterium]|nr:inorganic diphosphatase [Bryobacteraceae bacterium]
MSHSSPRPLTELDTFRTSGKDVSVIIETPKGSRNKFDYEPDLGVFELAGVLPEGSVFPYDFGFLPSTLAEDGDPLDVLVLLDESVSTGCLVSARLIGVIEAEQTETNGQKSRNDRLLAVATRAHTHADVKSLQDLRPKMVDEIEHFFRSYNQTKGKVFTPTGRGGPRKALEIVQAGIDRLKSQQRP